jgi:hypothetical protein
LNLGFTLAKQVLYYLSCQEVIFKDEMFVLAHGFRGFSP